MKTRYFNFTAKLSKLDFIYLLALRLVLAVGFYGPTMKKIEHFDGTIAYFTKLGIPLPTFNAYLATTTEILVIILLPLGLGVRFIALPAMITMLVAIFTVHWPHFSVSEKGYEIALYYFIMLLVLFIQGGGKISCDYWIAKRVQKK
ncbi:MAG: DoxX family protein [Bacteroidetes bacterium]|nr:DoxX family protein [Bacteroidota bacterium]